jgi:hypothetical protein
MKGSPGKRNAAAFAKAEGATPSDPPCPSSSHDSLSGTQVVQSTYPTDLMNWAERATLSTLMCTANMLRASTRKPPYLVG